MAYRDWDKIFNEEIPKYIGEASSITSLAEYLDIPRTTLRDALDREFDFPITDMAQLRQCFSQELPELAEKLLGYLQHRARENKVTILELCEKFDRGPGSIQDALDCLWDNGYNIEVHDDTETVRLSKDIPRERETIPIEYWTEQSRYYKFGVISDTHLCNRNSRLDVLYALYDKFEQEGIEVVFHAGNLLDGETRYNGQELLVHGVEGQVEYLYRNYPQKDGMITKFITGECFDGETEILTRDRGFVRFDEFLADDLPPVGVEVATVNLETGNWEWQAPEAYVKHEHNGEMYHFHSQRLDIMITPGHRVLHRQKYDERHPNMDYSWKATLAKDYKRGNKQFLKGVWGWHGEDSEYINIPRAGTTHPWAVANDRSKFLAEDFMQLVGWYLAEGSCYQTKIGIAQTITSPYYTEIVDLIKRLGFNPVCLDKEIQFSSIHLSNYFKKLGRSWEKYIPEELKQLSPKLLKELLFSYWKGDGNYKGEKTGDRGYSATASTSSQKLASDITEIAIKCGYAAGFSAYDRRGEEVKINGKSGRRNHLQHNINISFNQFPNYTIEPDEVLFDGLVYCVRVPNDTIIIKRNGKVSVQHQCHEGEWAKTIGLDIGRYINLAMRDRGREDLEWVGHIEADIKLAPDTILRLMHPGGGTAYALSYQPQRWVESLQGGEKPNIAVIGHYHKYGSFYMRNVYILMPGTTEDQTIFMRKKRIPAHVGGCIIEIKLTSEYGLGEVLHRWFPFYDKGYYQNWTYHDVALLQLGDEIGK